MKKMSYIKNIIFTITMLFVCLVLLIFKTFFPDILFPKFSIPIMVLLAVIPEVIVCYMKIEDDGCQIVSTILAGVVFALFPFVSGTVNKPIWVLFIVGIVVYAIVDFIYSWSIKRMRSGEMPITAPAVNGLLLFFASQAFSGLI